MSFDLKDVLTIEQDEDASREEICIALQRAINSGSAWSMQGSYGRAMMQAIDNGECLLGRVPCRDYWGNRIPSRTEVQEGTKGSRSFVAERMGEKWAKKMEELD